MTHFYRISIYAAVKTLFAKILYAAVIGRMSYLVRKSLNVSLGMIHDKQTGRAALFKRLYYFCLIPQFVNVLNLVPETLFLISKVVDNKRNTCERETFFEGTEIFFVVKLIFFSFGSFAYYICFLMAFPKVRSFFLCKKVADD